MKREDGVVGEGGRERVRRKRGRRGRGGERAVFRNLPCPPHLHLQTCLHQADDEYMISDYDLLPSRYVSVPKIELCPPHPPLLPPSLPSGG